MELTPPNIGALPPVALAPPPVNLQPNPMPVPSAPPTMAFDPNVVNQVFTPQSNEFSLKTDFEGVEDVESGNFRLLDPNLDYVFSVEKIELVTSSTNKPMIKMNLKTVLPEEYKGITVLTNMIVKGTADEIKVYKSFCKATDNLTPDGRYCSATKLDDFKFEPGTQKKKLVVAQIKHETYEGEPRNKIRFAYAKYVPSEVSVFANQTSPAPEIASVPPPIALSDDEWGPLTANEQGIPFRQNKKTGEWLRIE